MPSFLSLVAVADKWLQCDTQDVMEAKHLDLDFRTMGAKTVWPQAGCDPFRMGVGTVTGLVENHVAYSTYTNLSVKSTDNTVVNNLKNFN